MQYKARGRLWFGTYVGSSVFVVSPERPIREYVSPWLCQRRSHRARHAIPTSILVVHALLLARCHRDEQLLDAAIVSVVGSFLSSSTAVACWVNDGVMTLRFGMGVSSEGCCLTSCAGCVLLITFRKCVGQPYSRAPYSVLHTDRPICISDCIATFILLLGGARQNFETLLGIVPGLFIVRMAPSRRPLGTVHQQLCRHRDIVTAKQSKTSSHTFCFPE
jgi:hypothetical protein